MTRRPDSYTGAGTPVAGDVHDPASLAEPLTGVHTAYYLVHSLGSDDFERLDAEAARAFGEQAAKAGVRRIIYLGGLGAEDAALSPHLRSRRAVEGLLGEAGVPVTVLRAAVVIGARRHLVGDHPATGRSPAGDAGAALGEHPQPADRAGRRGPLPGRRARRSGQGNVVYEIGGPEVLQLQQMLQPGGPDPEPADAAGAGRAAADPAAVLGLAGAGHRRRPGHRPQPGRLDDHRGGRARPRRSPRWSRCSPMGYDDAVRAALAERAERAEEAASARRS